MSGWKLEDLERCNGYYIPQDEFNRISWDQPKNETLNNVCFSGVGPVEYTPQLGQSLLVFFRSREYPYRQNRGIPFGEPLRTQIYRFFCCLDSYIEAYHKEYIPINFILEGVCSGPAFATLLNRIRQKSLIKSIEEDPLEFPDWWEDVPWYLIDDIGQIFNYQYLIHWLEPDPEDYKFGDLPLIEPDQSILTEFEEVLLRILPDELKLIDPREILLNISGSVSYSKRTFKKGKNWDLKQTENTFAESIGVGIRSVIQVHPDGVRDSVIFNVPSLNRIQLIEQQTQVLLESFKESFMQRDPDKLERMLYKFGSMGVFLQRDLKKEGITKPRILLKSILKALHKKYPQSEAYRFVDFFDNFSLKIDETFFNPRRGHGLGMANALTTLMQIVIYRMCLDREDSDGLKVMKKTKCLALNDDFTVGFMSYEDREIYWDIEGKLMDQLGLIRNLKKSYFSETVFVIAERYGKNREFGRKLSYKISEILKCLACVNITHAKSLFSSIVQMVEPDILQTYMKEIVSFWGYEFFPEEVKYPTFCGGWFSTSLKGLSLELLTLEREPYNILIQKAFEASKINRITKVKRSGKPYLSPYYKLFGNLVIPNESERFFFIGDTGLIADMFDRPGKNPKITEGNWRNLYKKRQKVFLKRITPKPFENFIEEVLKQFPNKDFMPLSFMIDSYCKGDITTKEEVIDIYRSPNARLSALMYWNPHIKEDHIIPEEYSVCYIDSDNVGFKVGHDFRERLKKFVTQRTQEDWVGTMFYGVYRTSDKSFYRSYIRPHYVANAMQLYQQSEFPILKEKYRSPLIKKKEAIYGAIFSPDEQILLSKISKDPVIIKKIVNQMQINGTTFEELALNLEDLKRELELEQANKEEILPTPQVKEEFSEKRIVSSLAEYWTYISNSEDYYKTGLTDIFDQVRSVTGAWIFTINSSLHSLSKQDKLDLLPYYGDVSSTARMLIEKIITQFTEDSPSYLDIEEEQGDLFGFMEEEG
jgi:hypothetical protein